MAYSSKLVQSLFLLALCIYIVAALPVPTKTVNSLQGVQNLERPIPKAPPPPNKTAKIKVPSLSGILKKAKAGTLPNVKLPETECEKEGFFGLRDIQDGILERRIATKTGGRKAPSAPAKKIPKTKVPSLHILQKAKSGTLPSGPKISECEKKWDEMQGKKENEII